MASDFDDIFGDLKEDEQFSASLPSDFDEASIFGETPSSNKAPDAVTKPPASADATDTSTPATTALISTPAPAHDSDAPAAVAPAPATALASASSPSATSASGGGAPAKALWEQIGGTEQDDFLSWLDDSGAPPPSSEVQASDAMDDVSLDAPSPSVPPPASVGTTEEPTSLEPPVESSQLPEAPAVEATAPPAPIPIHVAGSTPAFADTVQTISLDDDDDDDDFLEKIVESAKKKAAASGSRESSSSSLHIKSQSSALQREPALDFGAIAKTFVDTGVLPPASRLAFWCHALRASDASGAISMYALQTTPLDLSNQPVLRKEVESLCTSIFASKLYLETIASAAAGGDDGVDGARLLFIDNAEILVTYVCKKLQLEAYPTGLAQTFAPLITTGGNDPLRLELVETMLAVCRSILPHLSKHVSVHAVAEARRPLLKWLLLYHAPEVAFHLDQHLHTWHLGAAAPSSSGSGKSQSVLLDSWLASMFEYESARDFDFLMKVWDCCVLVDSVGSASAKQDAGAVAHASTCMCFIVVYLIASRAGKKLLRMEGDQLRHCMGSALVDALKDVPSAQLLREVQRLIHATPPGFCSKLRDVGYAPPAPPTTSAESAATPAEPLVKRASTSNLGMSLISASATGVKELSSAMIDMPTKLLFMGSLSSKASASGAAAKDDASAQKATPLFEQLAEAGDRASLAIRLAAADVIPLVFQGFQAASPSAGASGESNAAIRYFIVDCRSAEELRGGQIPTAFHFDPDAVTDPTVLEHVLATLNPIKGKVHLCVMGHGYGHLVNEIRQQQERAGASAHPSPFAAKDDLFEAYATNLTRVNSALLFLTKQGFPYVSVLDGGYAAAHSELYHSTHLTVDDLIDHDTPQCAFCEHERCMAATSGSSAVSGSGAPSGVPAAPASAVATDGMASDNKSVSFSQSSRGNSSASMVPPPSSPSAAPKTASGQLDAKSLFDAHTGTNSSYFSSFAGALKTSGKSFMNPADSLKDSTKWLMKKTSSSATSDAQAKAPAGAQSPDAKSPSSAMGSAMPNFNKLRSSLAAMGSESLDLLKKAEQAAVAKTRAPFGGSAMLSPSAKAANASAGAASTSSPSSAGSGSASAAARAGNSATTAGDRNASFQRSEEEVFTIDDDDEEDDFVGGGGGAGGAGGSSRTSSSSSARNESFSGHGGSAPGPAPLHDVERGHVNALAKGMRVSRTQMLPCVESPFFSGYKKKKLAPASSDGPGATGRVSMLPRRLVIAENHLVVLKAERNLDDVYQVKSCHSLAHVARMTCLKKNALMVTVYYKWKAPDGHVVEKRNAYEVQQRDEFIKAIKGAMEKM